MNPTNHPHNVWTKRNLKIYPRIQNQFFLHQLATFHPSPRCNISPLQRGMRMHKLCNANACIVHCAMCMQVTLCIVHAVFIVQCPMHSLCMLQSPFAGMHPPLDSLLLLSSNLENKPSVDFNFTFWWQLLPQISSNFCNFEFVLPFLCPLLTQISHLI